MCSMRIGDHEVPYHHSCVHRPVNSQTVCVQVRAYPGRSRANRPNVQTSVNAGSPNRVRHGWFGGYITATPERYILHLRVRRAFTFSFYKLSISSSVTRKFDSKQIGARAVFGLVHSHVMIYLPVSVNHIHI